MFDLFKKKSPVEQLAKKQRQLLKEAHALSTSNRSASDSKYAEADEISKQIEALQKQ